MLKQKITKILFQLHGWRLTGRPMPDEVHRCVFVFAPHTSNWDFYFGVLCMMGWGVPIKVAIKKFWTQFPFSLIIKPIGGIGIDRARTRDGRRKNQVERLAQVFGEYDRIALVITPEGSRSLRTEWKTGFYHVAKMAAVPIVTLSGNFAERTVEFGPVFSGEEDLDDVMKEIMAFYRNGVARYPEKFSLDQRYI